MNWNNLQKYKCPKCNANLKQKSIIHVCSDNCGFVIKDSKLNELLQKPKKREVEHSEEDNLTYLNNFDKSEEGYEEFSEDNPKQ